MCRPILPLRTMLLNCEMFIAGFISLREVFSVVRKLNQMNRALGHLCAQTRPGEPPEDGEMIEMTLSSRHRSEARSTLPLGHRGSPQY